MEKSILKCFGEPLCSSAETLLEFRARDHLPAPGPAVLCGASTVAVAACSVQLCLSSDPQASNLQGMDSGSEPEPQVLGTS